MTTKITGINTLGPNATSTTSLTTRCADCDRLLIDGLGQLLGSLYVDDSGTTRCWKCHA